MAQVRTPAVEPSLSLVEKITVRRFNQNEKEVEQPTSGKRFCTMTTENKLIYEDLKLWNLLIIYK